MTKKFLFPLLAAALFFAGGSAAHAQQFRVGTVDMKRVFENYYKTKEAEQRINEARNLAKKELDERMEEYKKLTDEVQKLNDDLNRPELSKDAKEAKSRQRDDKIADLRTREGEIRAFQQSREKQLQEQTMRMRAGIVDEITVVINNRVKESQFDLVFDKSGQSLNGVPIVLYSRETYDFTTDVISALNKSKPSDDSPGTAPKGSPADAATANSGTSAKPTPKKR